MEVCQISRRQEGWISHSDNLYRDVWLNWQKSAEVVVLIRLRIGKGRTEYRIRSCLVSSVGQKYPKRVYLLEVGMESLGMAGCLVCFGGKQKGHPSLRMPQSDICIFEPPYTERYVRWCGRTGASHPLLPDLSAIRNYFIGKSIL